MKIFILFEFSLSFQAFSGIVSIYSVAGKTYPAGHPMCMRLQG